MSSNERMKELAAALQRAAVRVVSRVPDEGPILGWRGFHVDLDEVEDLANQLRDGARGVFRGSETYEAMKDGVGPNGETGIQKA